MRKKITGTMFAALLIIASLALIQCRGKKEIAAIPAGETPVDVLCSGEEYFTNNEYFRANSVGESIDQANSKRMALSNARAELAGQISVLVRGVVDNYFKQAGVETRAEFAQRYEGLFREIVDERLSGTRVICEEVTRTSNGIYKTYLAIELAGNDILSMADRRITNDERLRIDYDYERFKRTFDEEIEKLRQERGY
ncbi:MAG TPA: hypothetical protein ENN08_04525 [Bacteroidales bacterium]|nr:hypothetical protein [Bacteroidales bacterium]